MYSSHLCLLRYAALIHFLSCAYIDIQVPKSCFIEYLPTTRIVNDSGKIIVVCQHSNRFPWSVPVSHSSARRYVVQHCTTKQVLLVCLICDSVISNIWCMGCGVQEPPSWCAWSSKNAYSGLCASLLFLAEIGTWEDYRYIYNCYNRITEEIDIMQKGCRFPDCSCADLVWINECLNRKSGIILRNHTFKYSQKREVIFHWWSALHFERNTALKAWSKMICVPENQFWCFLYDLQRFSVWSPSGFQTGL